jgi:hypothetical protein
MKRYIDEMQSRGREIENEVDSKNLFDSGITRAIKSARMKRYIDEMQSRGREIENEVDSKNLFDSGITRAIKSARQSLGLDQDQEHKAIRKGLFRFSDALTQQYGDPRFTNRKGAVNNLASIAPAMAKGLEGYEDASDNIQHNNREVYEWAKKFRDSEIKRLRDEDKEAFDRYFADKKLGIELAKLDEQRDYHKGMLEKESKKRVTGDLTPHLSSSKKFVPITNEITKSRIEKKYSSSVDLLDEINNLEESYKTLEKMLNDRGIKNHPAFLNDYAIKYSGYVTPFTRQKDKDLAAQIGVVNSNAQRLSMHYESEDRKRGVTDFMVKYANDKSMYPDIKRPASFLPMLNELKKNAELSLFTTEESLKNGYQINKHNYKDYLKIYNTYNNPDNISSNLSAINPVKNNIKTSAPTITKKSDVNSVITDNKDQFTYFYDPETKKQYKVPSNEEHLALQKNRNLIKM